MRIALVHQRHARVGGTERLMDTIATHLARRGHEVVIVCRRHTDAPHPGVSFAVLHGFALGSSWRLWRFGRDVERHVAQTPYDLVVNMGKTWSHDVVYNAGVHATYVALAHRHVKRPWERMLGLGRLKNRVAIAAERRAFAPGAYRHVIAVSEMIARDIRAEHGVAESDLTVIHNGVDPGLFHPGLREGPGRALRAEFGFRDEHCVLLFLGRGFGRKGLDRLLEAVALLAPRQPSLRLLVVGDDHAAAAYHRQARQLGLQDRAVFAGSREDPQHSYAAGDVYALPARYDPCPLTVIEALATGLPVITTDRTGTSELLDPTVGSVVRAAGDAAELADAIEPWIDPERRRQARGPARALAEAHSFAAMLERVTEVLERAARTKRSQASTPTTAMAARSR